MTAGALPPRSGDDAAVRRGGARASRRGRAAAAAAPAMSADGELRRRLDGLRTSAEAELRRRGVLTLPLGDAADLAAGGGMDGEEGFSAEQDLPAVLRAVRAAPALGEALAHAVRRPGLPRLPSLEDVQRELPIQAMTATGRLALALRRWTGRDVIDLESMQELVSLAYRVAEVRRTHAHGEYEVDDFGFDRDWTEILLPPARLVYRRYWRVETTGAEHVPRRGGALLVSNHAGVLPLDGAMIKVALFEEGVDRHARALIADWFFTLPMLSWFLRRSGQTMGHPDDTLRLLRAGELVLVFPEGVKGTGKLWRERYRLRRFGRGGFVETAIRARVPIIPISVVGSEEIYPMIADIRPLAALTGFPYFPVTPTWPWLGPLGLVPLPSKWRIEFHAPIRTDRLDPDAAADRGAVMRIADEVRDTIQSGLIRNLMRRRGVFRG